jgi:hypothetical protein
MIKYRIDESLCTMIDRFGKNQVEEISCWAPECQADQIRASTNWLAPISHHGNSLVRASI